MRLESSLREKREAGRKLLVPYVTGGLGSRWLDVVEAVAAGGADAVEVGIPFSDPVMDGPTIQEASQTALEIGDATPSAIIGGLGKLDAEARRIYEANASVFQAAKLMLRRALDNA